MKIGKILTKEEKEEHKALTDEELAAFLWEVREQRPIIGIRKERMLQLFVTIAEKEGTTL